MIEPEAAEQFTFRRATDGDVTTIVEFNLQLALETEGKALNPETMQQGVARGIQQFPEAQYFIAECERQLVGQLMFTREWSDWRNGWMLWLQSVYVRQDFRGRGVFRNLLNSALAVVNKDSGAIGLRLYVEKENKPAIAAYERLQFKDAGYRILETVPITDEV
jgi:GNAT superfamily N-acetyltransferase